MFTKLAWYFKNRDRWSFSYQKNDKTMLSVAWNTVFTDYWKGLVLRWKYGFFWAKKLMERWYLLTTRNFLFWTFRRWELRSYFEPKSWCKDGIDCLLKSSCFKLFGDGKYGLVLSKKDGKIIFSWSFWAFHDIPGLGKYGFSCSGTKESFRKTRFVFRSIFF